MARRHADKLECRELAHPLETSDVSRHRSEAKRRCYVAQALLESKTDWRIA